MNKPTILVTNDDGIDSIGIYLLAEELKQIANVFVVAPSRQQSAVGHAITMSSPIRMQKYNKNEKFFGYAVDGTPADCVKLAVRSLFKNKPDLVVSGINHGSNTAISVIYSGTVSAATEGTILGIPSLAFSLTTYDEADFSFAAKFAKNFSSLVLKNSLPKGTLLNINIPAVPEEKINGVVFTRQGKSIWNDEFETRRDPSNREYFWLKGELLELDVDDGIDQKAINENKISITPLQFDLTDYKALEKMKNWDIEKLLSK